MFNTLKKVRSLLIQGMSPPTLSMGKGIRSLDGSGIFSCFISGNGMLSMLFSGRGIQLMSCFSGNGMSPMFKALGIIIGTVADTIVVAVTRTINANVTILAY